MNEEYITAFGFFGSLGLFAFVIPIIIGIITIWVFWRIFEKAGFPAALSILMIVPGLNFALLLFLAFFPWPVYKRFKKVEVKEESSSKASVSDVKEAHKLEAEPKIILDKPSTLFKKKDKEKGPEESTLSSSSTEEPFQHSSSNKKEIEEKKEKERKEEEKQKQKKQENND
jgi:hypothetical protein